MKKFKSALISDYTDFSSGENGWEFKSWMPNDRIATGEIISKPELSSQKIYWFYADGRDDDGILFLQKTYTSPAVTRSVQPSGSSSNRLVLLPRLCRQQKAGGNKPFCSSTLPAWSSLTCLNSIIEDFTEGLLLANHFSGV